MAPSEGDLRFPRSSHLRRSSDFQRNRRRGKKHHSAHFVVSISPGPGPSWRLGLVVSRKVGSAVHRNRVKRIVREVFRLDGEKIPPHSDIVVIARPGAARLSYEQARRQILGCLGGPERGAGG